MLGQALCSMLETTPEECAGGPGVDGGERTREAPGRGSVDPGSEGRGGCLRVKRGPPAGTAQMQAGQWQGWVWRQRNSPFRLEHRVCVSILRGARALPYGKGVCSHGLKLPQGC